MQKQPYLLGCFMIHDKRALKSVVMQYQYPTISPVFVSQGLPHPIIVDSYSHVCVARLKRRKTSLEAHHIPYCIISLKQGITGVTGGVGDQ